MKRCASLHVPVLVLLVGVFLAGPVRAASFDRFVNPFGTCSRDVIAGQPAHATIQEAVDAAAPGDLIGVCPGTYAESVAINTDNITLRPPGASAVHIVTPNPFFPQTGIDVNASGVTIRGFEVSGFAVRNAGCGIRVRGTGATVIDNDVHDNEEGICEGGLSALIMNNVLRENFFGIFLFRSQDATVLGNRVLRNDGDGIREIGTERSVIQQNVVTGNGFHGIQSLSSVDTHITRNTVRENHGGVRFDDTTGAVADGNVVADNAGDGLRIDNSSGCTVSLNRVSGSTGLGGIGLAVSATSSCLLDGNRVTGNADVGISVTGAGPGNTITRNVASGNEGAVDCFWDGSDAPAFANNACATEAPPGAWD